jgi:hypothetical protein
VLKSSGPRVMDCCFRVVYASRAGRAARPNAVSKSGAR